MNQHLNDGQLRAALDGQLGPHELDHLDQCSACQARRSVLQAQVQRTARRLAFLTPDETDPAPGAHPALYRFHHQNIQQETSMLKKIFASSLFRFGAALVVIVALVTAIPTTRALASQLLDLFRIQKVTVVPIDFTGMQQLSGNSALGKQVTQLLSSSTDVTQKPGAPVTVSDAAAASQMTGFTVRTPDGMTPSNISVQNAAAFTFKVDRAKAQALLDEAGRKDLVLPDSIDGSDISVTIPSSARVDYGACPTPKSDATSSAADNTKSIEKSVANLSKQYADCVLLAEIPSPTVQAPANLDIAQLAQIALEFTGMSKDQAAAFTKTVDWTSSLVIPIPKNGSTYEQVNVDGVQGTLIQRPADDAPEYALIWVKDGIIYSIGGLGSDSQKAIQMANSLH